MTKLKFEMDLMDKILVDLYEKEAFSFYQAPSAEYSGTLTEKELERINNLTPDIKLFERLNDQRKLEYKKKLNTIFAKQKPIISSFHNAINFLIDYGFIDPENGNNLYSLRLTPKGVDSAKKAIENDWERENKLSNKSISKTMMALTYVIGIATAINVAIALVNFFCE